jgi:hypothetical protein
VHFVDDWLSPMPSKAAMSHNRALCGNAAAVQLWEAVLLRGRRVKALNSVAKNNQAPDLIMGGDHIP